ncbi:MAG TPA: hypothetical protein VE289_09425 [Gaiellaceae bacterium]|nr:hypothetical protein [Gaiellaceae bacterium]
MGAREHPAIVVAGGRPGDSPGHRKEAPQGEGARGRMTALVELVDPFYAAIVFAVAWLVR